MRNEILHPHLVPRLLGLKATCSASTATMDIGARDFATPTSSGTGVVAAAPGEPFARAPVVVATPAGDVASGGYVTADTFTASALQYTARGVAGSGDDGVINSLIFGWDWTDDDLFSYHGGGHSVKGTSQAPMLAAYHITDAGAVTIGGKQATVTKSASPAGEYVFVFRDAFPRAPIVVASPIHASAAKAIAVSAVSATGFTVSVAQSGGTAEDNEFVVLVYGWMHKDEVSRQRNPISCYRRKPRMLAFRIDNDSGTPAVGVGSGIELTDNGTGDVTITLGDTVKTAAAGIAIVTAESGRAQLHSAPTTSAIRVLTFNAGGTAADDDFHVLWIGFDYADEY